MFLPGSPNCVPEVGPDSATVISRWVMYPMLPYTVRLHDICCLHFFSVQIVNELLQSGVHS